MSACANPIRARFTFAIVSTLVAAVCLAGCTKPVKKKTTEEPVVTECVLPDDQANSLQGRWARLPIKVSFRAGTFSSAEIQAVQAAAASWNDFYAQSKNAAAFDAAGYESNLNQSLPSCGNTLADGTVLYQRRSNWTKSPSAVAVTTFCFKNATDGGLSTIVNSIMEFNYQNFFVPRSGLLPDLESIALHELGHLLGLDHSCGALRTGLSNVACPDHNTDPNHFLVATVLFPSVLFDSTGAGEIKRSLTENDQGRANCLY